MATAEIFRDLSFLLAVAVVSHLVIRKFRQPTIIGEIAIGIVLGPTVLGVILGPRGLGVIPGSSLFDATLIENFAALGAIFLLFLVGLESDFRSIFTKTNFFVALGGVLLPFVIGFGLAFAMVPATEWGLNANQVTMAAFVGAALVATSTAIAASILLEIGMMRERVARTIMGAAVVDDVLGLLVLSIVVGSARSGGIDLVGVLLLVLAAGAFILIASFVGLYFFTRIVVWIQATGKKLGVPHGGFAIALALTFFYAFVAELIGLSAIVGAFLAGTMFASTPLREDFQEGARYLGAIFTPIFFISMGLLVNLWMIAAAPGLVVFGVVLIGVAILTKVIGCGIPSRLSKMSNRESLAVGLGMTPRGEVGLIVALTALTAGVIAGSLFSVIVLVMIVVSVLPAPFFKRIILRIAEERRSRATALGNPEPPRAT